MKNERKVRDKKNGDSEDRYVQSVTKASVHPLKQTKQTKRLESFKEVRRISLLDDV